MPKSNEERNARKEVVESVNKKTMEMKNMKRMMALMLMLFMVFAGVIPAYAETGIMSKDIPDAVEALTETDDAAVTKVVAAEAVEEEPVEDEIYRDDPASSAEKQEQAALLGTVIERVSYRTWDKNTRKLVEAFCADYTVIDSTTVEPAGGYTFENGKWYVVKGEVDFTHRIINNAAESDPAHLILTDGCVFHVPRGIENRSDRKLHIYGQGQDTGELIIDDVIEEDPAIGKNSRFTGSIAIFGGTIKAVGGYGAAGISVCQKKDAATVDIYGGNVTATGGYGSAGIGANMDENTGIIHIYGGNVTSTGGYGAAGIGGACSMSGSFKSFQGIYIEGGKVTAYGGYGGPGIGSGVQGSWGDLVISNAEIHATGGYGAAGIGNAKGNSGGGSITILSGNVEATGGEVATAFRGTPGEGTRVTFGDSMILFAGENRKKSRQIIIDDDLYQYRYVRAESRTDSILSIRFETNGGTAMFPQAVQYGGSAKKPKDPAKTGCEFAGWYSDPALTVLYDFASPVKENITLYAKWKTIPEPDDKEDPDSAPLFTGSEEHPVSGGVWKKDAAGFWHYITTRTFRNTWAYIVNPYAGEGQNKADWFRFDANGNMLAGWQLINGKWYYLDPVKGSGTYGACFIGPGRTPDGYEVDATGALHPMVNRVLERLSELEALPLLPLQMNLYS